ncbi:amastin-like surface protein-like protein [Trypanosoma theileri]|uniref:Amastin-like surface protein-like protein n=1 Tax=Trypanosoma theileri TaxID=67003 RepID=A0A1X0NVT7_9TRYP|nr:amastin-like surface protein-like protein [Trypanosoma theileri]ORC88731.1 amastin-like surface protein-like protein [Trypanosoma theileri]
MRCCGTYTLLLLLAIFQTIAFILIVVATPPDVFRSWDSNVCYSLFGEKKSCGRYGGSVKSSSWGCERRESTMNAAAAFAIISIAFSLIATIMAFLAYFRLCFVRLGLFIMTLLTAITLLISWACIADVYHKPMCGSSAGLKSTYSYGPAFGLIVFTWVLEVFLFILAVIVTF